MKREQLINEVKQEYQRIAEVEEKDHFINVSDETVLPSGKYYEFMLDHVINMIAYGAFDDFATGKDVVEAVTNNKPLVYEKWNNDLQATLTNQQTSSLES